MLTKEQHKISSTNPIGNIKKKPLYLFDFILTKITILHNFYIWFTTGISHIINWEAYDHVLFLFALCSIYTFSQWKKMLTLITAFTIGHSLTLALSVFRVFVLNTALVEFLIAVTIILTCLYNLRSDPERENKRMNAAFWMTACFGLIHGLGFAGVLKEMLFDDDILLPLFAFNVGLEAGQLLLVVVLLLLMHLVKTRFDLQHKALNFFLSAAIAIVASIVAVSRFTFLFDY